MRFNSELGSSGRAEQTVQLIGWLNDERRTSTYRLEQFRLRSSDDSIRTRLAWHRNLIVSGSNLKYGRTMAAEGVVVGRRGSTGQALVSMIQCDVCVYL